jgi:glycolate oxidase FAD binding subunit
MQAGAPFQPNDENEIAAFLRERAAAGAPVVLSGSGSKDAFGRAAGGNEARLDLSGISGITLYEPDELVLTAKAGTPIRDIAETVAARGQCLAFEPPAYGPLFGSDRESTLGGVVASGWSGPRRVKAGAVRDHVLGMRAVGGDGQVFKSGGRVVKNVTGFDLPKLLTGSHGTLAAFTEITIKVLPAPEATRTIAVDGLDDQTAIQLMSSLLGGPYEVAGAAHLPAPVGSSGAATLIRLEGFGPSVVDRCTSIEARLAGAHSYRVLESEESALLWQHVRDVAPLIAPDRVVWRVSLPATNAAAFVAAVGRETSVQALYDWGGGLVWLGLAPAPDGHAALVRRLLPSGHATLMRAPAEIRTAVPIFQPLSPAAASLARRVKAAFDPADILAPGRFAAEG